MTSDRTNPEVCGLNLHSCLHFCQLSGTNVMNGPISLQSDIRYSKELRIRLRGNNGTQIIGGLQKIISVVENIVFLFFLKAYENCVKKDLHNIV